MHAYYNFQSWICKKIAKWVLTWSGAMYSSCKIQVTAVIIWIFMHANEHINIYEYWHYQSCWILFHTVVSTQVPVFFLQKVATDVVSIFYIWINLFSCGAFQHLWIILTFSFFFSAKITQVFLSENLSHLLPLLVTLCLLWPCWHLDQYYQSSKWNWCV